MEIARLQIAVDAAKATRELKQFGDAAKTTTSTIKDLLGPLAAIGTVAGSLSKLVAVQRQFDVLNAGLQTATGSAAAASKAFVALQDFAAKTPYSLDQAVEGFTKLVNLGLTPSEAALKSYGNTASALGKDLNQMIEAVADAATGEFERLKEFGIKSKSEGDKVSFTFQGVTKTIGKNAAEIERYLTSIGENQFAGAMEKRINTLDGALSNFGDTMDGLFREVSAAGVGSLIEEQVRTATAAMQELTDQVASGQLQAELSAIAGKFDGFSSDISESLNIISGLFEDETGYWASLIDNNVKNMIDTFRNLPENVRALIQIMTVEIASGFDQVKAYARSFKDGINAIFTNDTFAGVGARLETELNIARSARESSIFSIIEERDAALNSFDSQIKESKRLRKEYSDREVEEGDRLGRYKVLAEEQVKATGEISKAAIKTAQSYQSLYDSLYPAEAAQRQYNEQVALLSKYLTGDKLAAAISKLNESIGDGDHDAAAKAVEDYRKEVETLEDRLDPVGKATKQYQKDVALLASAHSRGEISGEKYAAMLATLEGEYAKATEASSEWAQWTESALERVDGAFADAWKNIGDGFSGFRDSLTNAFKQMLAELAHMAITKPIVMQIGAALGIGGGSSGGGLLSSVMGGGSGGGMDFGKLLNYGQSIYSGLTGVGPAVLAGYQSGGIGGALSGGAGYYGNLAGNAASTVGGWFGMGGGAAASSAAGSTAAGYTGSAYSAWAAGQGGAGALAGPAAAAFAALQAYKAYGDGVRLDAKDTRGNAAAWATGYQPLAEISGAVSKLTEKLGIGGALGNILNIPSTMTAMVGSALFGGGWQTKDVGLALSVQDGDFVGQQYEYQKKKGGLFGSNKKRTRYSALDEETAAALQEVYDATEDTVAGLFESLSYSVEEASLAGLQLAQTQISTKGKTEEEIQQAIAEWFGTAADAMTAELNKVFATGLDLDFEGMQAFVGNLQGVNEVLRYLDVEMYEASVSGGKLAESLAAVSGGLEALAQNSQTYYDAFFTEAEKVEDTVDAITRAFESADVTLAGSRAEYRAMVEDIDLTTEAGREMFATMMALSGQAATYYSIVEQQAAQATAAANAALFGAVDTAYAALQRSIAAQQQEIQQAASATTSNINALTGVSNSLDAALKRLRGTSDETVKSLRAQAVMTLNSALVQARSGQSLAGFDGLQDALDTASQMDTDLYATLADFEREQGRTANLIKELESVNGKQLTAEQKMLRSLESQLSALDQQLAFAQSQLDALNGIDNSVKSVEAAVAAMNASVVAALSGMADGLAAKNTAANNSALIDSVYKSVLGRETDEAGAAFWQQQLASGNLDYDQLAKAIANDASKNANDPGAGSAADYLGSQGGLSVQDQVEAAYRATLGRSADIAGESYWMGLINSGAMTVDDLAAAIQLDAKVNGEIPGFAAGGFHSGGLRLVGENGPEIEATGPSRIFNAGQTADMLGGGSQADEVAAMRAEMTGALRAIAKHTQQTARRVEYLERWDFDGLPEQRAAV